MNHLLASDSHEISSFTWFLKVATQFKTVVFGGAFRVKIVDLYLPREGTPLWQEKAKFQYTAPEVSVCLDALTL